MYYKVTLYISEKYKLCIYSYNEYSDIKMDI